MSRVDATVVPMPGSPFSSSSTFNPRIAASRAIPAPLIPAPITITSKLGRTISCRAYTVSGETNLSRSPIILARLGQLKFEISQVENTRRSFSAHVFENPQFASILQQNACAGMRFAHFLAASVQIKKEHNNESLPAKNDSSPFHFSSHAFFNHSSR